MCDVCGAGFFTSGGTASTRTTCNSCLSGYSCDGSSTGIECLPGTYAAVGSSVCTACGSDNQFSGAGASSCTECNGGSYTSGGQADTRTACNNCPAGSACDGTSVVTECGAGYYAPAGASQCTECGADDMWSGPGANDCEQCNPGYYTFGGTETTRTSCSLCPAGNQCTFGDSHKIMCLSGFYAEEGSLYCFECGADNLYSSQLSESCSECPAGSFTSGGSETTRHDCDTCPAGYACSGNSYISECTTGSYSPSGSSGCTLCAAGKFGMGSAQTSEAAACTTCADGYYQSLPGQPSCMECAGHTHQMDDNYEECVGIDEGYYGCYEYNGQYSDTPFPGQFEDPDDAPHNAVCECEAGYQCIGGALDEAPCIAGTYSLAGSSTCTDCGADNLYSGNAASECLVCVDGFTSGGTSTTRTTCSECPAGYNCDGTSDFGAHPCVASTYSGHDGSTGQFYCINGGSVDGMTGYCSCTDCNTGFGGPNCATSCSNMAGEPSVASCNSCSGGAQSECEDGVCAAGYAVFDASTGTCAECVDMSVEVSVETCHTCSGVQQTQCDTATCAAGYVNFNSNTGTCSPCFDMSSEPSVDECNFCTGTSQSQCTSGTCAAGYQSFSSGTCSDINECAVGADECAINAQCINNIGSYDCQCNAGYVGDGFVCAPSACVASSSASADGSDGNFYCVNGGSVLGVTGECACNNCGDGYTGPNCATPCFDMASEPSVSTCTSCSGPLQLDCSSGECATGYTHFDPVSATCSANCYQGQVMSGVAVISFSTILHGSTSALACPEGFEGELSVSCSDGSASVLDGSCMQHCTGSMTSGDTSVAYSVNHGTTSTVSCPDGYAGDLSLSCYNGQTSLNAGSDTCAAHCYNGQVNSGNAIIEFEEIQHGDTVDLFCPGGYDGQLSVNCNNGLTSISDGVCSAHCFDGAVTSGDTSVSFSMILHGSTTTLQCPSGYDGELHVTCTDGQTSVDGLCTVPGCTDSSACNYDPASTVMVEGSCIYAAMYYDCFGNCLVDTDSDGICDMEEIAGCQDAAACNYNPAATDPGTCVYEEQFYDCDGVCLNDDDGNGICNELEAPDVVTTVVENPDGSTSVITTTTYYNGDTNTVTETQIGGVTVRTEIVDAVANDDGSTSYYTEVQDGNGVPTQYTIEVVTNNADGSTTTALEFQDPNGNTIGFAIQQVVPTNGGTTITTTQNQDANGDPTYTNVQSEVISPDGTVTVTSQSQDTEGIVFSTEHTITSPGKKVHPRAIYSMEHACMTRACTCTNNTSYVHMTSPNIIATSIKGVILHVTLNIHKRRRFVFGSNLYIFTDIDS